MEINEVSEIKIKKHIDFCEEYARTRDARRSYMKVYPKAKETSASSRASVLLARPEIQSYINFCMMEIINDSGLTKEILDNEVLFVAFSRDSRNFGSKLNAIKMLGQPLGLYTDKIEVITKEITVSAEIID